MKAFENYRVDLMYGTLFVSYPMRFNEKERYSTFELVSKTISSNAIFTVFPAASVFTERIFITRDVLSRTFAVQNGVNERLAGLLTFVISQ